SFTVTNDAPSLIPVGTNVVTWTVHDTHGNSATCQQVVIVTDHVPPALSCPALLTVEASAGMCGATNVNLGTPTVTGNCGSFTVTNDAPVLIPVVPNVVTSTVHDTHGNSATCQQVVIVTDHVPPSLS